MFRETMLLALVGALLLGSSAHAADRTLDAVRFPALALPTSTTPGTDAGNGIAAFVLPPAKGSTTSTIWTLSGAPNPALAHSGFTQATTITTKSRSSSGIEVGTDTAGVPVAAVTSTLPGSGRVTRLVRLDTGKARSFARVRKGLRVGSVAIDNGTLYYTVHPRTVGPRNTSSLWRARITGTTITTPKKIRTSRRGEKWMSVSADQNRVAINLERPIPSASYRQEIATGTPLGPWIRVGANDVESGPISTSYPAGFTRDRKAIIVIDAPEGAGPIASRVPLSGKGPITRVVLGASAEGSLYDAAYNAATQSFLVTGPDAAGTPSVGLTDVTLTP